MRASGIAAWCLYLFVLMVGNGQGRVTVMGETFRGKYVPDDILDCLAATGVPFPAVDLCECAEQAASQGYEMFRWELSDDCTFYPNGIPDDWPACNGTEGSVLYSVDVVSTPYTLTNIGPLAETIETVTITWENDQDSCFLAYRVELNGESEIVYETSATFNRLTEEDCVQYPVTVTALNAVTLADKSPSTTSQVVLWCSREIPQPSALGQ